MRGRIFMTEKLLTNLNRVRESIAGAAVNSGRRPEEILLLPVTKTVEADRINVILDAGVRAIGENRVQEITQKAPLLKSPDIHLIGHLQSNKVRQVLPLVGMIESVDSRKLAKEISECSLKLGRVTDILVEVNIGNDANKFGVRPEETYEFLHEISVFGGISVKGLMTIAPLTDKKSETQKFFSNMRQLFIDISSKKLDNINMNVLSMGMSDDYTLAVAEGSTLVRVGSAIFGHRA